MLTPAEKALLRAAFLFKVPVPTEVFEILAENVGADSEKSLKYRLASNLQTLRLSLKIRTLLAVTAENAVIALERRFEYIAAAHLARRAIDINTWERTSQGSDSVNMTALK